jgi:hypothetical protein
MAMDNIEHNIISQNLSYWPTMFLNVVAVPNKWICVKKYKSKIYWKVI